MGNFTVTRTIHPVGQGAFYTEHLSFDGKDYYIVYDCGTKTAGMFKNRKKCLFDDIIDKAFGKVSSIDILFVSHFDEDHINGIANLTKKCKIERLVIPQYDENYELFHIIRYFNNHKWPDDKNLFQFKMFDFHNAKSSVIEFMNLILKEEYKKNNKNKTKDDRIKYNKINEGDIEKISFVVSESSESVVNIENLGSIINSGQTLAFKLSSDTNTSIFWSYIPINCIKTSDVEELSKKINDKITEYNNKNQNQNQNQNQIKEEFFNDKSAQKEIKKIYKDIFGELNDSSMLVYSGKSLDGKLMVDKIDYKYMNETETKNDSSLKEGCLYTGDSNLKIKNDKKNNSIVDNINSMISKQIPNCGTFQIPHHGSNENFHIDVLKSIFGKADYKQTITFVSHGRWYGHPHRETVQMLRDENIPLIEVSDYPWTEYEQKIYLRKGTEPIITDFEMNESGNYKFFISAFPKETECGLCYSKIYDEPTINDKKVLSISDDNGEVKDSFDIKNNLEVYYIRAFATNKFGTSYSTNVIKLFS